MTFWGVVGATVVGLLLVSAIGALLQWWFSPERAFRSGVRDFLREARRTRRDSKW